VNVWEERFKIATNPGQVRFNRFGVNVATLKGDVITEGFGTEVNGNVMHFAEGEIEVGCRSVSAGSRVVNCHTKKDGSLVNQVIHCPKKPSWLPGHAGDVHFLTATNTS
jgi:hypothetical protein